MINDTTKKLTDDLLVIVVIYKLLIEEAPAWQSLLKHAHKSCIFIYDNSPVEQPVPNSGLQVIYHSDPDNSGVSRAYNEGCKFAQTLGMNWLLLLDQDTQLTADLFQKYSDAIYSYPDQDIFTPILIDTKGIVSPFHYKSGLSRRIKSVEAGLYSFAQHRVINTCCLIRRASFTRVEGYNEMLPLDYSDIYFQEKYLDYKPTFVVIDAQVLHSFSGTVMSDKKECLIRYNIFCKSCLTMSNLKGSQLLFYWSSLKRALNLSFRFSTFAFIIAHFRLWFKQ